MATASIAPAQSLPDLYIHFIWDGDECVVRENRYWEALTGPGSRSQDLVLVRRRYERVRGLTPHIPDWSEREGGTHPIHHWHYDGVYPAGVDQIQYCKTHSQCEPTLDLDKIVEDCGLKSCVVCGGGPFVVFYKKEGAGGDRLQKLTWGGKHHTHDPNRSLHFDEWAQSRYNRAWNKKVQISLPGREHNAEGVVSNYSRWSPKPIGKPFDDTYLLRVAAQLDRERKLLEGDPEMRLWLTQSYFEAENSATEVTHDTIKELNDFRKVLRIIFTPGISWSEEEIRKHPDFKSLVLKWSVIHGGSMGNDNTQHKQHGRAEARITEILGRGDYYEFDGAYDGWLQKNPVVYGDPATLIPTGCYALVTLDRKSRLYDLGVAEDNKEAAQAALEELRANVLKEAERMARYRGQSVTEARQRIDRAFDGASTHYIKSRFCGPDCAHCHDKAAKAEENQEVSA
jgi:hypothetical protein